MGKGGEVFTLCVIIGDVLSINMQRLLVVLSILDPA